MQQVNDWISSADDARAALAIFRKFVRDDSSAPQHPQTPHMVDPNVPTFIYILDKLCSAAPRQRDLVEEAFAIYAQAVQQSATLDIKSYEQLMELALLEPMGADDYQNDRIEQSHSCDDDDDVAASFNRVQYVANDLLRTLRETADSRMQQNPTPEALRGYLHMNQQSLTLEMESALKASAMREASHAVLIPDETDDKEFYTTSRNTIHEGDIPHKLIRDITTRKQIHHHLQQLPPYRALKAHPMIGRAISLVHQCRRSGMGRSGLSLLPQLFACSLQYHDTRSAILAFKSLVSMINNIHHNSFVQNETKVDSAEKRNEGDDGAKKESREQVIHTLFTELFIDLLAHHSHQLDIINRTIESLHEQYDQLHARWQKETNAHVKPVIRTRNLPTADTQIDGLQWSTVDIYLQRLKFDFSLVGYQLWQSVTSLKWSLSSPDGIDMSHTHDYKTILADKNLVWLRTSILQVPEGRFVMDSFVESIDETIASRISDIFGSFVKRYKQKRRSIMSLL